MRVAFLFRLTGSVSLLLLAACTSTSYHDLREDYAKKEYSDYYYQEISRVDDIVPRPNDAFLEDINAKLSDHHKRWSQELAETSPKRAIVDVKPERIRALSGLEDNELVEMLGKGISLNDLLAMGLSRNPRILSAEAEVKATLERFPQAVNLDTILNQYNAFTRELNTRLGPGNHKQMISMSFPGPGVLAMKGGIIDQDVFVALKRLEMVRRNWVAELKTTYFDYEFLGKALSINTENQKLLEEIIKVAQTQYKSNRTKYGNVILAQVELAKVTNALISLEQKRATSRAKLNTLLNLPIDTNLEPLATAQPEALKPDIKEIQTLALSNRQEIQIKNALVKRLELLVDLAEKMTYPDPSTGNSYYESRAIPAAGRTFENTRIISQKKSSGFVGRDAYIREMKKKVGVIQKELTDLENRTAYELKKAMFELDATDRSLKLHRTVLIPQANQALRTIRTSYTSGKVDFITYLDAQRTLLQVRLSNAEAVRNHQTAIASLDQLVGVYLERKPLKHKPLDERTDK